MTMGGIVYVSFPASEREDDHKQGHLPFSFFGCQRVGERTHGRIASHSEDGVIMSCWCFSFIFFLL